MNGFEQVHERIHMFTDAGQWQRGEYIVRCRDCKHMHAVRSWYSDNLVDECWLHANHENALGRYPTEPNGFCAWGERRDDE